MTEKLEKEVDKGEIEMTYLERIDSRDKDCPEISANYIKVYNDDHTSKLDASMATIYYGVIA